MEKTYNIIERLCINKKIDITEMCRQADVTRGILSDFKTGRTKKLSTATLEKIANYFDVSVDYLLGNTEQKKPLVNNDEELTAYLEDLKNRPELRMLFQLGRGATTQDVEKAVKIVEELFR